MAVGSVGSHKGNISNGNNINRGKPYLLMLLLAFGAALLGVMAVHKLRERRIFNLLVQEKDRELISLQLLLQKEKEYTNEMTRTTEEMKAKVYTLRTQKMELDRRLLEMQSTINSLKDEQKTMESALEEKRNEVRMLRETNMDLDKQTSRMIALTESLKQKEAEIEHLKRQLEYPVKVWSVSADDPSNPPINVTSNGNTALKDEIGEKKEDNQLGETTNYSKGVNSTGGNKMNEASNNHEVGETVRRETDGESRVSVSSGSDGSREEQSGMPENSVESIRIGEAAGKEIVDKSPDENVKNSMANSVEAIVHTDGNLSTTRDESGRMKSVDGGHSFNQKLGLRNSEQEEGNNHQVTSRGRSKLEMIGDSRSASNRDKRRNMRATRAKGKKWRLSAKNRWLDNRNNYENNEADRMKSRKSSGDDQGLEGKGETLVSNDRIVKLEDSSKQGTQELTNQSLDGRGNDIAIDANKESRHEVQKLEGEVSGFKNKINGSNMDNTNLKGDAEQMRVGSKQQKPEGKEVARGEQGVDAARGDFYRDTVSDLEEDDEGIKEETDETEF